MTGVIEPEDLSSLLCRKRRPSVFNRNYFEGTVPEDDAFNGELGHFHRSSRWKGFGLGILCEVICRDDGGSGPSESIGSAATAQSG